MKRYYIVPVTELAQGHFVGEYHGLVLDNFVPSAKGYSLVAVYDSAKQAPDTWQELPHLLDTVTLGEHGKGHHLLLADLGITDAHRTWDVVKALLKHSPVFMP